MSYDLEESPTLHTHYPLLLGETKDFGVGEFSSIEAKKKILKEAYDFSSLQGAFQGVPAIVIGAGSSLNLDGIDLDPKLKERALILSGGSALEWVEKKGIVPHFSLILDPFCNEARFEKVKRKGSRALFTLRANSSVIISWKGPKWLLSTEAFHLWETAWHPTKIQLNIGWNVATALGAFAKFLGCSSVIFLGVDLSEGKEGKLYSDGILTTPEDQERWCRREEWELAKTWLFDFYSNATLAGMKVYVGENSLLHTIPKIPLREFAASYCKETHSIEEMIQTIEQTKPILEQSFSEFKIAYKASFNEVARLCDSFLEGQEMDLLFLEPIYQKILSPLWKIWSPRFKEACKDRNISWREKEQMIAFLFNVLKTYQEKQIF